MIYILKSGGFKQSKYTSAQKLIEVFKLDGLDDAVGLDRQLAKGNNVYCWVSPYVSEIDHLQVMCWGTDPEKELDKYWQNNEEI